METCHSPGLSLSTCSMTATISARPAGFPVLCISTETGIPNSLPMIGGSSWERGGRSDASTLADPNQADCCCFLNLAQRAFCPSDIFLRAAADSLCLAGRSPADVRPAMGVRTFIAASRPRSSFRSSARLVCKSARIGRRLIIPVVLSTRGSSASATSIVTISPLGEHSNSESVSTFGAPTGFAKPSAPS